MDNRGQMPLDGNITFIEQDFTPALPSAGGAVRAYMKGDNFILQYNNGGTAYYKYIDLTGTVGTWTHGTAAP